MLLETAAQRRPATISDVKAARGDPDGNVRTDQAVVDRDVLVADRPLKFAERGGERVDLSHGLTVNAKCPAARSAPSASEA